MYIMRHAEKHVLESLSNNKILILLGARQVGKTTLIEHIQHNTQQNLLLNMDIEVDRARFELTSRLSPQAALQNLGTPKLIIIDEAQQYPDTARIVKGWYDTKMSVKVILLGSSSLDLLNQSAESLTGRNEKIYLTPLLFSEVLPTQSWYTPKAKEHLTSIFQNQISTLLSQHITYGSYPETITTPDKEKYLLNLSTDYLLKDILQTGLIKNPNRIWKLLLMLSHQVGSEVSTSELANNLNISRQTIERYLDLLEQIFVIFKLPAYSTNPRKEIIKSHKIYFWDTGIRNALQKLFTPVEFRNDIGALWENWVIAEFAKKNILEGNKKNLYFWRSRSGSEIDLVVQKNENISAYEIKWSQKSRRIKTSFYKKYNTAPHIIYRQNITKYIL